MPEQTPTEFFQNYNKQIEDVCFQMGLQISELNARLEEIFQGVGSKAEHQIRELVKNLEESGVADAIGKMNAGFDDMTQEKEKELKRARRKTNIDPKLQQAYYRRL